MRHAYFQRDFYGSLEPPPPSPLPFTLNIARLAMAVKGTMFLSLAHIQNEDNELSSIVLVALVRPGTTM